MLRPPFPARPGCAAALLAASAITLASGCSSSLGGRFFDDTPYAGDIQPTVARPQVAAPPPEPVPEVESSPAAAPLLPVEEAEAIAPPPAAAAEAPGPVPQAPPPSNQVAEEPPEPAPVTTVEDVEELPPPPAPEAPPFEIDVEPPPPLANPAFPDEAAEQDPRSLPGTPDAITDEPPTDELPPVETGVEVPPPLADPAIPDEAVEPTPGDLPAVNEAITEEPPAETLADVAAETAVPEVPPEPPPAEPPAASVQAPSPSQPLSRPAAPTTYPNLADVPTRPENLSTPQQRADAIARLQADRARLQGDAAGLPPAERPAPAIEATASRPAADIADSPDAGAAPSPAPAAVDYPQPELAPTDQPPVAPTQPEAGGEQAPQTAMGAPREDLAMAPDVGFSLTNPTAASGPARAATIFFAGDSTTLTEGDRVLLRGVAERQRESGARVTVVGHAANPDPSDGVSERLRLQGISLERANAVREALVGLGVAPDAIAIEAATDDDAGEAGAFSQRADVYLRL